MRVRRKTGLDQGMASYIIQMAFVTRESLEMESDVDMGYLNLIISKSTMEIGLMTRYKARAK